MALTQQTYSLGTISDSLRDQASLIRLQIMNEISLGDPYASLYEGGTVAPHEGETITTQLAGRPVMNKSFTAPAFVAKSTLCNLKGEQADFGSEQYTATLEGTRGESQLICVHNNFNKLDRELEQHVNGLKENIKEFVMADHRYNLLLNSGHKYVARSTLGFNQRITGAEYTVATGFVGGLPDATLTWRQLVRLVKELKTRMRITGFGFGANLHARFIGSAELVENLRNEQTNHAELSTLAQGGDRETIAAFKSFNWEMPYRGISMAEDERPLRFNTVNASGFPVLIEPYEVKVGNAGEHETIQDDWIEAEYEVSFLALGMPFKKLVPEDLTVGGGGARWAPQNVIGTVEWLMERDMTVNKYGDLGQWIWQVIRAYQPTKPWAVVPILSKRCSPGDDITACTDSVSEA